MKNFSNSGQTLIEIVIALGAILITLTSISILVAISISNSSFIKAQSTAAKYAQDGMEYVRYLRNNNLSSFQSKNGSYCLDEVTEQNKNDPFTLLCLTPNIKDEFIREVDFSKNTFNCPSPTGTQLSQTEVTVKVSWRDTKCGAANIYCHTSILVSCFVDPSKSGGAL